MEPRPSFGERLLNAFLRFVRALATLVFVLLLLAGIVAAGYYGIPYLYRTYVQPLEETQGKVQALEQGVTQQLEQLNAQVQQLTEDNALLHAQLDEALGRLDAQAAQIEALQQALDEHTQALAVLQEQAAALSDGLDAAQARLDQVEQTLADDAPWRRVERTLQVLQIMEHLTRARVYLIQSNFGLARDEVVRAHALVADLALADPAAWEEILSRLQAALNELPDRPVVAAEDLEIAWRLLNATLPVPGPQGTAAATPTPTPVFTPSPTPTAAP